MRTRLQVRLDDYFLPLLLFDFPAFDNAIATACFGGLPAAISVLMFSLTTFFDLPFFNGICFHLHSQEYECHTSLLKQLSRFLEPVPLRERTVRVRPRSDDRANSA